MFLKLLPIFYVTLHNIKIFGFHGWYEEERILGNHFIVNAKVGFTLQNPASLNNTVNYEDLLRLVQINFSNPFKLLEEPVHTLSNQLKEKYHFIEYLFISVKKCHPPLSAEVEFSEVSFEKKYEPL